MLCVQPASIPPTMRSAWATRATARVCSVSLVLAPCSAKVTVVSPSRSEFPAASTAMLVKTRRSGGTISRKMPFIGYSAPSGARMTIRNAPPGRRPRLEDERARRVEDAGDRQFTLGRRRRFRWSSHRKVPFLDPISQMSDFARRCGPVVMPAVLIGDRRRRQRVIRGIVEASKVDRVEIADPRELALPERLDAAAAAEAMADAPAAEPILREKVLAAEQPEGVRHRDDLPETRFRADRAVASAGFLREVDIGLEANGAAVAAAGIGLPHRAPRNDDGYQARARCSANRSKVLDQPSRCLSRCSTDGKTAWRKIIVVFPRSSAKVTVTRVSWPRRADSSSHAKVKTRRSGSTTSR